MEFQSNTSSSLHSPTDYMRISDFSTLISHYNHTQMAYERQWDEHEHVEIQLDWYFKYSTENSIKGRFAALSYTALAKQITIKTHLDLFSAHSFALPSPPLW